MKVPLGSLGICECCGQWGVRHCHHFMSGRNRKLKAGEKNEAGVQQKIIKLCPVCHNDVHSLSSDKFFEKYHEPKSKYLYTSKIHDERWWDFLTE